jgi:hypothetical protein
MKKLMYAVAGVLALAPLAAIAPASAVVAHPASAATAAAHQALAAAHAARPLNLDPNKCWKITDADSGNYGSLGVNSADDVVSEHSTWLDFCPLTLGNGYQMLLPAGSTATEAMAYCADCTDHVVLYYLNSAIGSPNCDLPSSEASAAKYCEWNPTDNSSGNWTFQNAYNSDYLTSVGSGKAVTLAAYGASGDQHWTVTCQSGC